MNKALDLQPTNADAVYARGISLKHLGRHAEAIEAYSAVIAQVGRHALAHHGRATVRYKLGDYQGAIADFADCLPELDMYDVRLLRGSAYHRIGRHQDAISDLSRAISLRPEIGSTYIRRWQVYKELGDSESAAKDFEMGNKLLAQSKNVHE